MEKINPSSDINKSTDKKNIFQKFAEERYEWSSDIKKLSEALRDIYKVADMQVELYSKTQSALEYYHYILSLCSRKNMEWRGIKVKELENIHLNYDIKFKSGADKEAYIQNKFKKQYMIKEALDNHLLFMKDILGLLNTMAYGIKYRVELESFKRTPQEK